MVKLKKPTVLLQWTGEVGTLARLEDGGAKVPFEKGTVRDCEFNRAKHLSGAFKPFAVVEFDDLDDKEKKDLDKYRKGEDDLTKKLVKEREKAAAEEAKRQEAEAKLVEKVKSLLDELGRKDDSLWANKDEAGLKLVVKTLEAELKGVKLENEELEVEEEVEEEVEVETPEVEEEEEVEEEVVEEEEVEEEKSK